MNAGVAQWAALIQRASEATGVPASVIAAVMTVESGGNAQARSNVGAQGLMQIMPNVWNRDGRLNLYDPYTNILKGAQILADNYKRYGNWNETFQRYYGIGNRNTSQGYASKVEGALAGIPKGWGGGAAAPATEPDGTGPTLPAYPGMKPTVKVGQVQWAPRVTQRTTAAESLLSGATSGQTLWGEWPRY